MRQSREAVALLTRLRQLASGGRAFSSTSSSGLISSSPARLAELAHGELPAAARGRTLLQRPPLHVHSRGPRFQGIRWAQTATAAAESLSAAAQPAFKPVPPSPLRPLHVSKERLSLKAQVIFESSFKKIQEKYKDRLVCPREVVWLNGAPGSGKGTNLAFIMKSRGLSRAIGMSQLLDTSQDIKNIIDRGELVPDHMVLDALLEVVLNPETNDGAGLVIDGFPRTALQVDFVKLLHDKLMALSLERADTPEEWRFPRPSFKVVILYVDEEESVRRQMRRAQLASLHNKRVMDAGTGDVWDVRTTDVNEALCRRRYQVFKAHYHTILRLKSFFPFSLIDAMGTLEEARQQIMRELRYQSSLDLDEATYAAIRHLPLARDLVRVARQRLVFRLDAYCKRDKQLFGDVIKLIDSEVLPVLKQSSLAGAAEYRTQSEVLGRNPHAVDILIDVLSDRGFSVAHTLEERVCPLRVDLSTGEIVNKKDNIHIFRVTFDKENVRDLSTPTSVTTRQGEDVAIGTTYIPQHLLREESKRVIEATQWSPIPKRKKQQQAAPAAAAGDNSCIGAVAAARSRSAAPSSLAEVATPLQPQQQQQQQQQPAMAAALQPIAGIAAAAAAAGAAGDAAPGLEGYTQASAVAGSVQRDAAQVGAAAQKDSLDNGITFLSGWDSMDAELSAANRQREYGFLELYAPLDEMNDRED